jgi:putative ABC transport system ATP-binding protein
VVELSIGQQQRVAAARALIGKPKIIIADEPTSSLDYDNRTAFIELLLDQVNQADSTLLFVSHDPTLEPLFDRTINLQQLNQVGGHQ